VRRRSTADHTEPAWRHAGRECTTRKSLGEGCCSRPGGSPAGCGSAQESDAKPLYALSEAQARDERKRECFSLKPSSLPSWFLARNTRSPHSLCRSHASLSRNVWQTSMHLVIAGRRTARRTAYTRSPSTIRPVFLSPLLSLGPHSGLSKGPTISSMLETKSATPLHRGRHAERLMPRERSCSV